MENENSDIFNEKNLIFQIDNKPLWFFLTENVFIYFCRARKA